MLSTHMRPPLPLTDARDRLMNYLRIECGLSPNTLAAYHRDLRDLLDDLATQSITTTDALTPRLLIEHLADLRRKRSLQASTIARHVASVRIFCRWLASEGYSDETLSELIERPSQWQKIPEVLSETKVRALIEAPQPPKDPRSLPIWLRDRALLEFLYGSGLRASEAADLRLENVHSTLGFLMVTGKGSKQRLVPFGKPAETALKTYLEECRPKLAKPDGRDGGRIFLSRTGRPLERVAIWQIVKRHARTAGLTGVYPHLLRHSFATHLLSGGADLRVVQELLGHANITTTQIYTRVDQPRLREVVRKFHPRG